MSLEKLFPKTVYIRLTDNESGFISTVRDGILPPRSTTWNLGVPEMDPAEVDNSFAPALIRLRKRRNRFE